MNNLQSNERHLADKLRQAPVPDADRSWEQMRQLLEREMPEAAGGWAGNKRWWWMGITAGLIMLAVWLTQQLNENEQKELAAKTQSVSNGVAANNNDDKKSNTTSIDKNNSPKSTGDKDQQNNDASTVQPVINDENNATDNSVAVSDKTNSTKGFIEEGTKKVDNDAVVQSLNKSNTKNSSEEVIAGRRGQATQRKTGKYSPVNNTSSFERNLTSSQKNNNTVQPGTGRRLNESAVDQNTAENAIVNTEVKVANVNAIIAERHIAKPADEFELIEAAKSNALAVSGKTDKAYLKQLRKKSIKEDNRRMSRSGMGGNFGDDGREITFAAGITVPQGFALGQQQASPYSVSGKSNRFMDYLPAPFFQYHINNKLFLQTEFHFQSPQYTDRLLLARSTTEPSTNTRLEKNVYLEKLYYFNIPLNLYYTPARNFSIGSGLQYSSLLSGVASFEEKRMEGQTTSSYQSVTRRFKDDSVAAKFAPSEWRYQFDANYYFKRFTLGLRYNQALKDFVNLQVNPALPMTQDRNKSFLLYLRFNVWEERKKD